MCTENQRSIFVGLKISSLAAIFGMRKARIASGLGKNDARGAGDIF